MGRQAIWSVQFYNERRGVLACYCVEAALPPSAVLLARRALDTEYPRAAAPAVVASLYQQARADRNDGGWVLYRIASIDQPGPPRPTPQRMARHKKA
jgi:hypothetical protein